MRGGAAGPARLVDEAGRAHARCPLVSTRALAGIHSLLDDEAVIVGGTNHSCHTKDL